jgi:hypothetical protein
VTYNEVLISCKSERQVFKHLSFLSKIGLNSTKSMDLILPVFNILFIISLPPSRVKPSFTGVPVPGTK